MKFPSSSKIEILQYRIVAVVKFHRTCSNLREHIFHFFQIISSSLFLIRNEKYASLIPIIYWQHSRLLLSVDYYRSVEVLCIQSLLLATISFSWSIHKNRCYCILPKFYEDLNASLLKLAHSHNLIILSYWLTLESLLTEPFLVVRTSLKCLLTGLRKMRNGCTIASDFSI